ncbi:amino acid adenylation domain-containing protein [Streptomyces sp. DSM 42041]|uniref:Amino acid adenylation domain-containing protein n=1 Tax=Streptomyces hazeniae TaxID=3075538 RepID=A0ABU2NPV2_9ACTN|nr:non-ribosomal peptide synthetase/type I polyketide synthase [Streptomyces sp. DSM 42041]MDT0379017.1 amino acid adenylation domain-containing protein [Streptomyces sp. DSM 42041]
MERVPGPALYRGPEPEFTEDDPRNAVQALLRAADAFPDAGVVTVGRDGTSVELPYPELLDRARRLLTGLRAHGLRAGDALVLCGLALEDFFPAFWAAVLGGARPVSIAEPAEPESAALQRLRHTAALLDAPLVLCDADAGPGIAHAVPRSRVVPVGELPHHEPADDLADPEEDGEVALLMLSSGSTGTPKAAQLTHGGLADFAASSRRILDVRPEHTTVNWLPPDHSGAFLLYHVLPVFTGSTNVHAPTERVLAEPLRWLDLLDAHRAHHSWAPTFAYQMVAEALRTRPDSRWDLHRLRTLVCGGEHVSLPVLRRFLDATAPSGVREHHLVPAWGMAETVTAVAYGRLDRPGTVHRLLRSSLGGELATADDTTPEADRVTFVASGPPAHGTALRVLDDAGEPLPERRVGRLQVRSAARLTPGYVRAPEADTALYPAGREWLDTGDLAFLAGGQVVVTGRHKDVMVLNGHNVHCHEVEETLAAVPGLRSGDVAACGVPDPDRGTESLAVFFCARGPAEDARLVREIRRTLFAALRLTASHVVPVPPDEFPRTPAGKVRRSALRDRPETAPLRPEPQGPPPSPPGGDLLRLVQREIAAELGREAPADVPFYELGLESVQLVRVRTRLEERLGRRLRQVALFEHPTAGELAAHLARDAEASDSAVRGASDVTSQTASHGTPHRPPHGTSAPAVDGRSDDRRIAVVGMAARFPGASSVEAFWAGLREGRSALRVLSPEELADAGLSPQQIRDPLRVPVAGVLDGADAFDPEFFRMSPAEAELTHPGHRLFLECCHEALENAGHTANGAGTRTGVFAGSGMHLYGHQQARPGVQDTEPVDPPSGMRATIGREPDFLATRVAYRLGLTGPAIGVQTACSTSLVAVHLAVQALLNDDADLALAGAAAVHTPQETGYRSHPESILSPTGTCRAFAAGADGTVGGNGVAAVLLKRLDRALADGDTVHAVILGSAVNNDGAAKAGFSAPGVPGQTEVVRRALRTANVPATSVSYVEAHGTGTPLGDPVEFEALARALGEDTDRTGFCTLGSVKPAIGHLDSCAGMAGLIKTVLMLRHRTLVPTLNVDRPHPDLDLTGGPLVLGTELRPWRTPDGGPLRAGVSALGVGGTNAHVVLEEAPARPAAAEPAFPVLVPVSADDPQALAELTGRLAGQLRREPAPAAADVAATLALGRPHRAARTAVVGRTTEELADALERSAAGAEPPAAAGPLAFAFPGQGSAGPGAGRDLYAAFPAYARVLDRCAEVFADEFSGRLLPLLLGDPDGGERGSESGGAAWDTETAQPALFAHQTALAGLWRTWGADPALLLGHSVGEYAALCAGGALALEDGLRLTAWRGRLMQRSCPAGGMIAARMDAEQAERVARLAGAEVAACNGPRSHVLSGPPGALAEAGRALDDEGLSWRTLPVDRAFHSAAVEGAVEEFRSHAERVPFGPLHTPFVTGTDGRVRLPGWVPDAGYLCRQARLPVRFDLTMAAADAHGVADFLESGPGAVLSGLGRHCLPASRWLDAQGEGADQVSGALESLGRLYRGGADPDWHAVVRGGGRIPLPGHPLRRRRIAAARPAFPAPAPAPAPATPAAVPEPSGGAGTGPAAGTEPVAGDVLEAVRELAAAKLGVELSDTGPDRSFFDLGADSLVLIGLATDIERRFGVRVPVREVFSDADTPRRLAARVAALLGDADTAPPAAPAADTPPSAAPATPPAPPAPPVPDAADPPTGHTGHTGADAGLTALFDRQLQLAERLVDQVSGVLAAQLDVLGRRDRADAPPAPVPAPAPAEAPARPAAKDALPKAPWPPGPAGRPSSAPAVAEEAGTPGGACDVSLYFFGDYPDDDAPDKYGLLLSAAEFADRHGFHALWFPERHFESFGGLFPNPSVLAAALAARTRRIRLHAGSVVLPLHHPVRVAEEWSVVDNISGGRVGLCFASGWRATDFALAPDNYGRHRELMYEHLETVRRLWAGDTLTVTGGDGREADVRLHPRPVQEQPPLYVAVVGNPDSYRRAAAEGLGVVTNLMTQTVEQLAENIALYRRTRAEHGLDPDAGRIVVLVHTYLGEDAETARAEAYRPFVSYLRSSLSLFDQVTNSLGVDIDLDRADDEDVEFLLGRAYERYCASRALIGDGTTAEETVRRLVAAGANEIACFVDFGVPAPQVLDALPALDRLRRRVSRPAGATEPPPERTPARKPERTPEQGPTAAHAPADATREPLSPAQRRIWFLEQLHPGTSMYHEPKAVRFDGALDVPALQWALRQCADRHPALRTVFGSTDGVPHRRTLPSLPLDCPVTDRAGATEEEALRDVLDTDGRRVFDLAEGPLVSARLLRLSDERHLLFLLAHHLVFDSSSTAALLRDVAACYRARVGGTPPPPAPLPAAPPAAPGPEASAAALEFWRTALRDAPDSTLPSDRPRPAARSGAGASLTHHLDAELVGGLQRLAAGHRATLFMALTAAVAAVLGRFGGRDDVVLGTAVASRPPEAEDQVGLFLDTVALRVRLDGDPDFAGLLHRVRETSTAAYEHREVPFDELVAALAPRRDPGRNPLFQVLVEYEEEGRVAFDPPRLHSTLLDMPSERAPFDLSVYLTRHADGLRVMVEYDTDLYDRGTVDRFVDHVEQVLRRALDDPAATLPALTAPTAADRARLAELGGHHRAPTPVDAPGGDTLHGLVEQRVRACPDAVALVGGGETLSYRELDARADRLARDLRARGARRGARVALLLPRGPELIVSILAVLKSGAAYLPLEPSAPGPRLARLYEDGSPVLLVTTGELHRRHPSLATGSVHLVDRADTADETASDGAEASGAAAAGAPASEAAGGDGDGDAAPPAVRPEDPAYLLHTSGSTGRPKGVVVPHRGPAHLVRTHLAAHRPLRTLQWTSPTFDVSVQEIFTTLAAGATLVLVGEEERRDPAELAATVRRHEVQRLFMPYTPLKYLLDAAPDVPSLREVFSAGEPLHLAPAFHRFLTAHPGCTLYNQYGPTEASVIVTSQRVDPAAGDRPPIGRPLPGARIRLLDPDGREVPPGAVGEIHIGGVPVAHGYLGLPDETAAAFPPDGSGGTAYRTGDLARWRGDGTLEYRGRVDEQVKIRGHRVEPAEVQHALNAAPGVLDAAVVARRDDRGEAELVAYVVPADGGRDTTALRTALAAELPEHLLPAHWVAVERLPVAASGKLDRSRLPDPVPAQPADDPADLPATDAERDLHRVWAEVLGRERVPVTRSFFELGGHSLSAIRLLNRMREEAGVQLSMADFFHRPTLRGVAAGAREAAGPAGAGEAHDPGHSSEPDATGVTASVPLTSTLRRLWRRHHDRADGSVYHVAHRIDLRGDVDVPSLRDALRALVRRHDALRSRLAVRDGEHVVEVLADVPVEVPVDEPPLAADDEDAWTDWCLDHASRPFALDRAPLFRFRLGRVGPQRWVLLTVLHHAVCDGWSLGVLWRELECLYDASRSGSGQQLKVPGLQFTDVARAEQRLPEERRRALEKFWRSELDGVAALVPRLPCDGVRPALLSGRGALHRFVIDGELPGLVEKCAAGAGSTPYAVLAAAFALWLGEVCDHRGDVVLAASSANRTRGAYDEVVGLLGDAVLLRARVAEAATFADLAAQVGATLFSVLDKQELPLTEVVRLVEPETAERPFPTVLFTVVTTPPPRLHLPGASATVRSLPTCGVARNELYVVLVPGEGRIEVVLEYSTDLFHASTVAAWGERFTALLAAAVRAPHTAPDALGT